MDLSMQVGQYTCVKTTTVPEEAWEVISWAVQNQQRQCETIYANETLNQYICTLHLPGMVSHKAVLSILVIHEQYDEVSRVNTTPVYSSFKAPKRH